MILTKAKLSSILSLLCFSNIFKKEKKRTKRKFKNWIGQQHIEHTELFVNF